jgi:NAD(P)H-dependent flavin oxidoreductase YrpB (nitropropane dioxygenase family)
VSVSAARRFSQAIAEGDGISLIARVTAPEDAARAEEEGAEAVLVRARGEDALAGIRTATSLPVLLTWDREGRTPLETADACLVDAAEHDSLAQLYRRLVEACEVALRIDDEELLAQALEELDPEIFVLAAPEADGEEALEHVLDLLPDVPAGKLAIAELSISTADDVGALERAGFDGVIVEPDSVAELAGAAGPEV